MSITVSPFVMFQGDGAVALDFYASLFPDARIEELQLYAAGESGPAGMIRFARFTVGGQSVLCADSVVNHDFSFTPFFSFRVECGSESEVHRLSEALKAGGREMMPAADYGFSALFAWVSDRFGVSWQLNFG